MGRGPTHKEKNGCWNVGTTAWMVLRDSQDGVCVIGLHHTHGV